MSTRRMYPGVRVMLAALLAAAPAVACADDHAAPPATAPSTTPATAAPTQPHVVVDTDLAVDDLIALSLLLSARDLDVRAVTVSGTGEVRCPAGLTIARGLLALTDHEEVPVACGRTTPLADGHSFPDEWRDLADEGWGIELPEVAPPATEQTATELLADVLAAGDTTILTLGPATNLAEAFRAQPALVDGVSSIVMMAGALDVPGNVVVGTQGPLTAEWNVYADPVAAAEVLRSGAPVTMVGLDATNTVPVSGDLVEQLGINSHTAAARLVHDVLLNNPGVYSGEAFFWDPLAAAAVLDPALLTTESLAIHVVLEEGSDIGRTVRSDDGPRVSVALGADATAFEQLLVATLAGLAAGETPTALPPPVADIAIHYVGGECTVTGPTAIGPGRLRVTFDTDEAGWNGAIATTTSTLTDREIIELVAAKGADAADELGVGSVSQLFAVGGTRLTVARARLIAICGDDAGTVRVAGTISVAS